MHNKRVFIDTSIQIERVLSTHGRQLQLREYLSTSTDQFISSHYVYMEFQRSIIADHAAVHRQMLQHNEWEQINVGLHSGSRSFRPRSLKRSSQILTRMMAASQMNQRTAINLAKFLIEWDLRKLFWRNVTPIDNHILCDLVQAGVRQNEDNSYRVPDACRKATANCSLPTFLASQRPKLQLILDYLSKHAGAVKSQERLEQLLAKIIKDPKDALGQSTCWPLGDVIIALQVPADAFLWTTDNDLGALCRAIDVPLYAPDF